MEKVENAALTNEVAPPAKKNKTAVKKAQTSSDKQISSDKRGKGSAKSKGSGEKAREEKAKANPKIEIKFRTELLEVKGEGIVESAIFLNNETGEQWEYKADEEDGTFGVFIFVGYVPLTKLFEGKVNMEEGYIITDEEMKTNIQGVFACGDLRPKMLKQVITATADGAIAAISVNKYIEANF